MRKNKLLHIFEWFICIVFILSLSLLFFDFLFPLKYKNLINKYSELNGLDSSLVASIIKVESRFNKNAISNKGAIGLMQIMPATAKMFLEENKTKGDIGEDGDSLVLKEPEENIKIGTTYLKYLFEKFSDEITVLACFNAGETVVLKWMEGDLYLKKSKIKYTETRNYVDKVLGLKQIYRFRLRF